MMPEFNTNDPVEELKSARALFGHSKTYMKCLENAVTSMDDNERFVTYLVELGRRHQVRPLKAHYLDVSRLSLLTGFPFSQFIRPGRLCSDDSDFFDKSVTMCQFFEKRGWWPAWTTKTGYRAQKLTDNRHYKRLRRKTLIAFHSLSHFTLKTTHLNSSFLKTQN